MQVKKEIKVIREDMGNNESAVKKGVFLTTDGEYWWVTYTSSGVVKRLNTAMRKAGFDE